MLDYKFGPNNTYLVACSYGPDSMALLDMMRKAGVSPIVCYVNYHAGTLSEESEEMLRRYCLQKRLVLEVCDAAQVEQKGRDENFGQWSREVRYNFFQKIYKKYKAAAIFVSHHQDDVIENYLLLKKQGIQATKYGWEPISTFREMIVVRPLLSYTRDDLLDYCQENGVPFSLDVSKFELENQGSTIRKDVVSRLNEVERDQILTQMKSEMSERQELAEQVSEEIKVQDELEIRPLLALPQGVYAKAIIDFVNAKSPEHITVTPELLEDIRKLCTNPKPIMSLHVQGKVSFVKEYDMLTLDTDGLDLPYSYTMEKPGKFSCEVFDLDFSNGAEDRGIKASDYPLTIRNVLPADMMIYGGYLVPVKRMLIAAGTPARLVHLWPVFISKDGKIIYVPRYRKDFREYHSQSKLTIHMNDDER